MIDVIKAILRSLGLDLKDVRIQRIHEDLGNGLVVPTDDWNVAFEYKEFTIAIELNKVSSRESWTSLVRYHKGDMINLQEVKLADITAEELREVINYFINKEE